MFIIFFSVVTVFFYIMIHNKLQCLLQMHTGVRQKVLFRLNCFKMLDRWFPLEHTFTLADSFTFYERQCNFLTEFIARSEYLLRHRLPLLRRFVLCKTPPCMFHTHTTRCCSVNNYDVQARKFKTTTWGLGQKRESFVPWI